jgi:hypothetical protein
MPINEEHVTGVKIHTFPKETVENDALVTGLKTVNGVLTNVNFTFATILLWFRQNVLSLFIPSTAKGAADGVAELDANGKVPATQIDLSSKQDTITASGILKGDGNGCVSAAVSGTDYQAPLTAGTDYATPGMIPSVPAASTVAPPMDGTAAPGTSLNYAREDHVHPSDTGKQDALTFDNAPAHGSGNPVTGGGIYDAITAVPPWYGGVDLTSVFSSEIAASPYNGDPWAWIKGRITDGDWTGLHIGDYIPFTTTETTPQTLNAQIMGIDTYTGYGDTMVGHHIDWCCKELWGTRHPANPVNFNNGTKFGDAAATEYPWLASDLYLYLNSLSGTVASATSVGGGTGTAKNYTSGGVYYYLPSALKAQIVEKRAYLPKRYNASSLLSDDNAGGWTNIGKLWLPSECEVYGSPCWGGKGSYATMGNSIQYPLFACNMNRVKKRSGSRDSWWLLSASSYDTMNFCRVTNYGSAALYNASGTVLAAPVCFRIA